MKKFRKTAAVLAIALITLTIYVYAAAGNASEGEAELFEPLKTTVRLWYSDEAMADYYNEKAVGFNETHSTVRIEPALVSGVEMLEQISRASLENENYPDLYVVTNDTLEKAHLAGLTTAIPGDNPIMSTTRFPEVALNAVTYDGNYVAYPFYYETSTLLYNRTYLEMLAREELEYERAEQGGGGGALSVTDEEVALRANEMVPSSIADILTFAGTYSLPGEVEGVFKWDVTDIFYNYFFVGNYMDAGGPAGDSITSLDLYNSEMVSCLKTYQMLNTYFAIDASETDYDSIVEEFINGKMVFTVATSDAITRIRAAQADGTCEYEFGAAQIPSLNDYYKTRTMSVTGCVVINGYSEHAAYAAEFAEYMIGTTDASLFTRTGKLPALNGLEYEDDTLKTYFEVYTESVPLPKMIETSNLWMRMEITLTQIWNGANCNQALKDMSEAIMKQVVGRHYEEMLLPEPDMIAVTDDTNKD